MPHFIFIYKGDAKGKNTNLDITKVQTVQVEMPLRLLIE